VIVNNNIVLIDTYDRLAARGRRRLRGDLETCRERARPVVLTAVTAILGVLPIAFRHEHRVHDARITSSRRRPPGVCGGPSCTTAI
jgi:multidrug efflux pump subunit AcrB